MDKVSQLQRDKNNLTNHTIALSDSLTSVFSQWKASQSQTQKLQNQVKRERITTICVANELVELQLPDLSELWSMNEAKFDQIYNLVLTSYKDKLATMKK